MELLEHQLLEVQRVAGVVQDKLAEAQSVKTLYDRSASSFQYGRLLDCMMEASEHAECLTDRLRGFVLRNTFNSPLKEDYCLKLVQIHEIRVEYEDCILKAELPMLLPHRKKNIQTISINLFFWHCRIGVKSVSSRGRKFLYTRRQRSVLFMSMIKKCRKPGFGTMTI
ncbi:hypothetical protein CLOSTHATH_03083 [Hungatella hathewayi DSM 13479]|uniref:Uncharacterized protein n=1 Tax=Hungatella hathewayi DSM 13479 TaxID=566550 RepID=D3AHJ5_9FIRM|nr:hypothetical protein CLOSTHATH_03083 [Hungatella hathewayi DSM 13479]